MITDIYTAKHIIFRSGESLSSLSPGQNQAISNQADHMCFNNEAGNVRSTVGGDDGREEEYVTLKTIAPRTEQKIEATTKIATDTFALTPQYLPAPLSPQDQIAFKSRIDDWNTFEQMILSMQKIEKIRERKSKGWEQRNCDKLQGMAKMVNNSLKAIGEYRVKLRSCLNVATPKEALDALVCNQTIDRPFPANSISNICEFQGCRNHMEDVTLFLENEERILAGVFDGHSSIRTEKDKHPRGYVVAHYVKESFRLNFDNFLNEFNKNIYTIMETIISSAQESLKKKLYDYCMEAGTTAVVAYFDKISRLMYVATVGDSLATIYRKIDGQMKAIPASRELNWKSPSEANRAANFHFNESTPITEGKPVDHYKKKKQKLYGKWTTSDEPKQLRSKNIEKKLNEFAEIVICPKGINISRTIGDFNHSGTVNHPLIICKPKLTVFPVQEGDTIILASDGVEDYLTKEIVGALVSQSAPEILADTIVNFAYKEGKSTDNISVVAITIPCSK